MLYRYYSTLRPIGPGTFPKEGMIRFENYNSRIPVREINRMAWGHLDYRERLPNNVADNYDLMFAGEIKEEKQ